MLDTYCSTKKKYFFSKPHRKYVFKDGLVPKGECESLDLGGAIPSSSLDLCVTLNKSLLFLALFSPSVDIGIILTCIVMMYKIAVHLK